MLKPIFCIALLALTALLLANAQEISDENPVSPFGQNGQVSPVSPQAFSGEDEQAGSQDEVTPSNNNDRRPHRHTRRDRKDCPLHQLIQQLNEAIRQMMEQFRRRSFPPNNRDGDNEFYNPSTRSSTTPTMSPTPSTPSPVSSTTHTPGL